MCKYVCKYVRNVKQLKNSAVIEVRAIKPVEYNNVNNCGKY